MLWSCHNTEVTWLPRQNQHNTDLACLLGLVFAWVDLFVNLSCQGIPLPLSYVLSACVKGIKMHIQYLHERFMNLSIWIHNIRGVRNNRKQRGSLQLSLLDDTRRVKRWVETIVGFAFNHLMEVFAAQAQEQSESTEQAKSDSTVFI